MAEPPTNPSPPSTEPDRIEAKLRAAYHRQRQYAHTRGLARLAVVFILALLASWLLDWLLRLDAPGRIVLLAANLGLLIYTGWHHWWRRLTPYDPAALALQVEKAHPELRSLLISSVQFRGRTGTEAERMGFSARLLAAARRQADQVTAALDFREIVDFQTLQRLLLTAAVLTALLLMAMAIWPGHFRSLAHRLLNPFAAVVYPTRTQIQTITGDRTVRRGDPLTLTVTAGGLVPQRGEMRIRPAPDRPWDAAEIANEGDGRFEYHLPEVYQSFEYHARIGDDRTAVYEVRVIDAPRIVDAEVIAAYPPQVGREREELDGLDHRVPEGTELTWRVTFDRPLESFEMVRIDRETAPTAEQPEGATQPVASARLTDDPTVATATQRARGDFSYRFRYRDAAHGFAYDDPVEHTIRITPDAPPTVEVTQPAELELTATARKTLEVGFQAGDDFGLTRATLHYQRNDEPPRRQPLGEYDRRFVNERFTWTPREDLPNLAAGDEITWWIEVADNHLDSPKVGQSAERRIVIVSVADYQRMIYERIETLTEELERVRQEEGRAAESVDELKQRTNAPEQP